MGNARAAFKKQPTVLALLSDTAEPKISAVLFQVFYFLSRTQCLHYPECNWLCYPLRRFWVEISFTKLKAVLLNGSTQLLMKLWFDLIPKRTMNWFSRNVRSADWSCEHNFDVFKLMWRSCYQTVVYLNRLAPCTGQVSGFTTHSYADGRGCDATHSNLGE